MAAPSHISGFPPSAFNSASVAYWSIMREGIGEGLGEMPAEALAHLILTWLDHHREAIEDRSIIAEMCQTRDTHNFSGLIFADDIAPGAPLRSPEFEGLAGGMDQLKRLKSDEDGNPSYSIGFAGGTLRKVGKLYLRGVLPPAVLLEPSDPHGEESWIQIADSEASLGFTKTLLFNGLSVIVHPGGRRFLLGVLYVPTSKLNAPEWRKLVSQACCVTKEATIVLPDRECTISVQTSDRAGDADLNRPWWRLW